MSITAQEVMDKERKTRLPDDYHPRSLDETVLVRAPLPDRDFGDPDKNILFKWSASMSPSGTVVINLIHQYHPDALCQIQCPLDEKGRYHAFRLHTSPTEDFIPDQIACFVFEQIVWPEVWETLTERFMIGKPID